MSHQFTVLHISDLHERGPREKERARRYRVLGAAWQKNLEELQQEGPIDLVCFTGDLADWGQAEEYERVGTLLDALLKQLGLGRERLFLVPGNHDIDRKILPDRTQKSPEQLAFEKLRSNLHNATPLHVARWLEGGKPPFGFEQEWLDLTLSRQSAYRDFLRKFGLAKLLPRNELHPHLGYRVSLRLPTLPFPLQVVGLDSSWLAGDDADSGRLRLTDGQVMRLCLDAEGGALPGFRLALVHHPLSDLADASQCRTLLADAVHLLLRGHMHESELTEWADSDRKLRSMAAGCLYEGERADQYPNSCSVIRVQCDEAGLPLRYDVRLRSFSARSGHWFDDGGIYRNAPSGRLTIQLAAPPPVPPVVYESEPRDHGAAARALPVLRTEFLRELFAELLRTSDDLNSFALDFFPSVHRQFSSGMTREAREDLLLSEALPLAVYEALRALFGSKVPPPPLADTAARATLPNPYRGLLVFGVQDAPLFFGRAKKTTDLRQLFDAAVMTAPEAGPVSPRLVAVLGPSGSGKSSLVQAGLLADLLRKPPIGGSYLAAVLRPQGRPLRALARVLTKLKHASTEWPLSEIDAIVERLHKDPRALGDLVSDVLTQPEQRLLLVIDQLEELYTMAEPSEAATAERRAFVAAILTAASERRGRVDVVVTLRSDLLGEVGVDPALQQALTTTGRVLLVGSLDAEELAEAITGPSARAGRPLPPDAVALLVREAEGQAGALPLLQFTMEKLWRAIDDAPSRPIADLLRELGGVGGSLAQEAEALYRGLHPQRPKLPTDPEPPPSAAQVRARRAFSRLLQTRDGQVLGRRRQALADLVGAGETLADMRAVLDRFVDSRLLVLDGEETEATVEIGHESLGRSWQRLARWLSEASAYLPVLLRLSEDARRWHRQGRPGWLLWRGDDLALLRKALPALETNDDLGAGERAFSVASVRGARRRQVLAVSGVLSLVGALLGVGTLALWAREQAKVAQQRLGEAVRVADLVVFNFNKRLAGIPGTADLRKGLLVDAMSMLDELRKQAGAGEDTALLRTRSAGHIQRGTVAMTHDNLTLAQHEYREALRIFEALADRHPSSAQAQRDLSISLQRLGEVAVQMGQLGEAKVWFERSLKISEKQALADAKDAQAQRDLSISLNKLGDVAVQMGQLGEAKVWFERSLKISEKQALADAKDAQAQRDLSISINKLGDVAVQMGQLGEAKVWFERSLKISEKLALADANDAQAQRDLSISLQRLGDVAVKMGQLGEAKVWFERSLKISEKLALADANDAQAQRDPSSSLQRLGDVAVKMGQLGEAKVWFERSLKISEKLALADANDAQAQRDLSISLQRLGDVAVKMGQMGEAKVWFERSLKIREKLALADANDAQAQRDLSLSLNKLGDVAVKMGQMGEAKVWFERFLKISEKLALADANDAQAQRDLSISLQRLGDVAVKMGQLGEAKVWFERSLKISEKLALADAKDAQAQRDLSISLNMLGDVAVQMGQLGEAKVWFERSLKIREKLALADAKDAQAQRDLSISLNKLGDVAVKMGQLGEAKVWFERDLKISEKLALADANDAQAQRDLIVSHYMMANLYNRLGPPSVARSEAQVAATLLARLRPRLTKSDADSIEQALRTLLR